MINEIEALERTKKNRTLIFTWVFGVVGLLIGVPCFTIIYEIVKNFISERLEEKNLPADTDYYENHELEIDSKGRIKS